MLCPKFPWNICSGAFGGSSDSVFISEALEDNTFTVNSSVRDSTYAGGLDMNSDEDFLFGVALFP